MRDAEAIADVVLTTMRAALAPVLERLAATEARLGALADVRDRLIVVETKSTHPVMTLPEIPQVDLSPLTERLAAIETRLTQVEASRDAAALTALHERVAVVETKTAVPVAAPDVPPAVDLSPITERLAVAEKMLGGLTALPERMAVMETKSALPMPVAEVDLSPITRRQDALETAMAAHINRESTEISKDISVLFYRMDSMEKRAPIPGPVGPTGKDGDPGKNGADGIVALDELSIAQENDRTLVFRARNKDIGTLTVPVDIYRGVFVEGRTYERGDGVTYGGSEWHCNETTTTKPGESKHWTLKVKRGRDGKDGRDAPSLPVVKVG
jgi:hypothetical protein